MYISKMRRKAQNPVFKSVDFGTAIALFCVATYFAVFNPALLLVVCFTSAVALSFSLLNQGAIYATGYGFPVKRWHVLTAVLALTAIFGSLGEPGYAQFFDSLEQAVTSVITEADTGIDEGVITTIFVFFRIIIILAFLVGVVVVFSQATRGNDWQPIANLLGVGVAFVIGVEVITALILGDSAG